MYRSHSCGELRASHANTEVTLSGWVQKSRDKGFVIWVDLRDRYGITQLIFDEDRTPKEMMEKAKSLGREFVIQVTGAVIERESKNAKMATGAIEVLVSKLEILNASITPPFTIEDKTDGGEDIRMKYRYLDIRRNPVKDSLIFRHKVSMEVRKYLSDQEFIEVETPYLIKSTPEGARDFVVPSRMNEGQFYALPQSPQTFKQLLMVGGMDKYFQIVKCFRDEDLRADRQPEFTQIDCEMAFVEQEDILTVFEGLTRHLLKEINNVEVAEFPRMKYDDAMRLYGNDKPDIRFGMEFGELNEITQHKDFGVFNSAELVVGFAVPGGNSYTRKEIDNIIKWVKRPQVGALGMIYCRVNEDGSFKSSVDKFYDQEDLAKWAEKTGAKAGDLVCVLSGETNKVRAQLSALRMELATRLGLRDPKVFAPLWVIDFPLLELDEETGHYHAMHHPFTSPKPGQMELLDIDPGAVKANAYDLVLNGNEIGGGSIRIHDKQMQATMLRHLGFSDEDAKAQFGFLMDAFEYGAPPHGGLAFGLDRLVAILGGQETIRDFIAFPKNNSGRDVMIDAPAFIDDAQLKELSLKIDDISEDEFNNEKVYKYPKFVKKVTSRIENKKRYFLKVEIDENKNDSVLVILRNPNKANNNVSDVTVNRVINYIFRNRETNFDLENVGNIIIVNLIPNYMTNSKGLINLKNGAVDKENLSIIDAFCKTNKSVILGWGKHPPNLLKEYNNLKKSVHNILEKNNNKTFYVDKLSESKNPKHAQIWGYNDELKKYNV